MDLRHSPTDGGARTQLSSTVVLLNTCHLGEKIVDELPGISR
jgi:hypothetical protein